MTITAKPKVERLIQTNNGASQVFLDISRHLEEQLRNEEGGEPSIEVASVRFNRLGANHCKDSIGALGFSERTGNLNSLSIPTSVSPCAISPATMPTG